MPIKAKANGLLLVLLVTLSGCCIDASGTYKYEPIKDVAFTVNTTKLKYHKDIKAVFLYFELTIENKSDKEIYFNLGEIKAELNGEKSTETYYDSLASVLPKKERLKNGQTKLNLYFVFSEKQKNTELKEFKVIDYGLS